MNKQNNIIGYTVFNGKLYSIINKNKEVVIEESQATDI